MDNLSQIKAGFKEYLIDKYGDDISSNISSYDSGTSIFMYSSDFKQYLVDNGYADSSIFNQNITDIEQQLMSGELDEQNSQYLAEAQNSDFVNQSSQNTQNVNADTNAPEVESNTFVDGVMGFVESVGEVIQKGIGIFETMLNGIANAFKAPEQTETQETMPVDDVLTSIYNSEEAMEYLDIDGDGEIGDIEKEMFESYVQGDKEELTTEDLQAALKEMKDGTYQYDVKLPDDAVSVQDIQGTTAAQSEPVRENVSARQTSDPSQNLTSTGRSYSNKGNSLKTAPDTSPSDINQMNLEQLKTEQSKRQSNVDVKQENVDTILSDIDEIENGKYIEAKEAYDNAVKNDENISEELNERRTNNLSEIEKTNSEISSLNSQISQTEISLNTANNKLDADTKTLSALKSSLASYESIFLDDPEEQAAIEQTKRQLQAQINELENTTIPTDEKECERLDKLLNGSDDSQGLKGQLEAKQEQLTLLQEEKDQIEEEIEEACKDNPNSPTMKALEEFNAVEDELEQLKEKLPQAQQDLSSALSELDEVNKLINTKQAQETETKNEYYDGSLPDELVEQLDAKLGDGFCAKLEQVAKNINCNPADLIGMMQSESGINPSAYNNNGGATGLIQFMPSTARSLGTTTSELLNMSAIEQLDYVEQYFSNWTGGSGEELTGGDLYTLCFLPAYLDRDVLCSSSDSSTSSYYRANSVLDADKDGKITKEELDLRVENKYQEVLNKYGISE